MTEIEIQLVQSTYAQIKAGSTRMARYFYNRLSELDSSLEPLFEEDKANLGIEFALLLDKAVNSLQNPAELAAELVELKSKLDQFKRSTDTINTIGSAFIDTLSYIFGKDFKPQILKAWANGFKSYAVILSDV